jgi:hypothetical protein
MRTTDYEHFLKKFQPVMNEDEIKQFDWTNSKDWKTIQENSKKNLVWTCVDCDGKFYFTPGLHYVNRMFYILCNNSYVSEVDTRDYKW